MKIQENIETVTLALTGLICIAIPMDERLRCREQKQPQEDLEENPATHE
jgi:hypothetical protein